MGSNFSYFIFGKGVQKHFGVQFFFEGVQIKIGVQYYLFLGATKNWGSNFILGAGAKKNWGSNLVYFWGPKKLGVQKKCGPFFSLWVQKKWGTTFYFLGGGGIKKSGPIFGGSPFFYFCGPEKLAVQGFNLWGLIYIFVGVKKNWGPIFCGGPKIIGGPFFYFLDVPKNWGSNFILGAGGPKNCGSNLFYFGGQ